VSSCPLSVRILFPCACRAACKCTAADAWSGIWLVVFIKKSEQTEKNTELQPGQSRPGLTRFCFDFPLHSYTRDRTHTHLFTSPVATAHPQPPHTGHATWKDNVLIARVSRTQASPAIKSASHSTTAKQRSTRSETENKTHITQHRAERRERHDIPWGEGRSRGRDAPSVWL
jgi:hypothetical protein